MTSASQVEALLAEDRWIRSLARRLVADPHAADDLAQDAYLTALADGVRPRDARAWLGGILRNLWRDLARSSARRARREAQAAVPEATASTDELVAEVELRKHVAELVLALDEPLRRALILRFFQDRSLSELAQAEGISVSTAHERVERGLVRLRAQLDAAHRCDRRAWAAGVAALAARGAATRVLWRGMLMGTVVKTAFAFLVLGALGWLTLGREPRTVVEPSAAPVVESALEPSVAPAPALREGVAQREQGVPESVRGDSGSRGEALEAQVRGRVLALDGSPLAGIPVGLLCQPFMDDPVPEHGPQTTSADDGSFTLALPSGSQLVRPIDLDPARILLAVEERDTGEGGREWRLTLTDASPYAGDVVDEAGAPIEGAEVRVELDGCYLRDHGFRRLMDMQREWKTTSDSLGRFVLPLAPAGEAVVLRASAAGFLPTDVRATGAVQAVQVVLRRGPDDVPLRGIVLGPDGAPLPGARVVTMFEAATSAGDGTFTVLWHAKATHSIGLPDGSRMRRTETHITATKEGLRPLHVPLASLDLAAPLVLRLEEELRITGRVVDAHGEPQESVSVWVSDLTPLGTYVGGSPDPCLPLSVETLGSSEPGCTSAAEGQFELRHLLDREYHVMAFDPRTLSFTGPWLLAAGSAGVTLVLEEEPGTARLAGRILTADGEPLAGVRMFLQRTAPGGLAFGGDMDSAVVTDATGGFEFPAVVLTDTQLTCFHDSFFVHSVPLASLADPEHVEVIAPRMCEVQIELGDPGLADRACFLDEDGHRLAALIFDSNSITVHAELGLSRGRSEVALLAGSARTLVLEQAGAEVLRMPVHLDPAQRTVLRP